MAKVLVVGSSGDIGSAIVTQLLRQNHTVIAHHFTTLQSNLTFRNGVTFWQQDLTSIIDYIPDELKEVDVIIYAAGTAYYELFQSSLESKINEQYMIHVHNLMKITQALLPYMIRQQFGKVIVINSIWGETGASMEVVYSTMKAAQIGFIKSLAKEVALSGITVNGIAPGLVKGKMTNMFSEEEKHEILEDIPLGRYIEPSEIAQMVSFLISDAANNITGQIMRINGGWLI